MSTAAIDKANLEAAMLGLSRADAAFYRLTHAGLSDAALVRALDTWEAHVRGRQVGEKNLARCHDDGRNVNRQRACQERAIAGLVRQEYVREHILPKLRAGYVRNRGKMRGEFRSRLRAMARRYNLVAWPNGIGR